MGRANRLTLIGIAAFAFGWIAVRAAIQSIVIDEADSYMLFARGAWPGPVYPSSGNHVLYTLLSRWSTTVFGLSELTVRLPALLGAALFIRACYAVCLLVSDRLILQAPLLVSLVYNPFVMDYLTAARGYSLALGFLMTAIALVAEAMLGDDAGLLGKCALVSACAALSFSANFSFAFVDGAAIGLFLIWAVPRVGKAAVAACILPGLVIAGAICGYTLWHWPSGQFIFGAGSFSEMCQSVVSDSFDRWNDRRLQDAKAAFAAMAVLLIPAMAVKLDRRRRVFWVYVAGVLGTALFLHGCAFAGMHVLLPKDRTAVFIAPLVTLLFGTALAARIEVGKWLVLAVASLWFLACLRVGYFKEWRYNSDSRELYRVLREVNRRCGVQKPVTAWFYVGVLNFYRERFKDERLEYFEVASPPFKPGAEAYVLYWPDSEGFIREQGLKVVYRGDVTLAVVAVSEGCGRRD